MYGFRDREIIGEEWENGIAETYTNRRKKEGFKNQAEMVDDIWNVLYSVSECDVLKDFAINKLQLDEKTADNFSKTKLAQGFATLSLKAIRKILPFLEQGFGYTEAVFLANIPTVNSTFECITSKFIFLIIFTAFIG